MNIEKRVYKQYEVAREQYAKIGVDTDEVIEQVDKIPVSIHCWQGDDVTGFEDPDRELSGGIQVTGAYPGKARNAEELRSDIEKALSMIPGTHRVNLHAIYAETEGEKVDRFVPRARLKDSLDQILSDPISKEYNLDAVESKLFGIGSESYVVGSHEFYMGYSMQKNILLCLDAGHFHPTEKISDKISAILQFIPEILLHVSRPVRWDSDHVVTFDDELQNIAQQIVRGDVIEVEKLKEAELSCIPTR